MAENSKIKGRVCVTGGTGFLGSWMVKRLLEDGYSVNTTIRSSSSGTKKDITYLTSLPGASERLKIFNADFEKPDSFAAAIEGCVGVFHVAHPIDFLNEDSKSLGALLGILQACVDSKTVKRVLYTSSASSVMFNEKASEILDESSWTDVDYVKKENLFGSSYYISKTIAEKTAHEFAEKHSLDLVSVIPSWIHGPFICSNCPSSVGVSMAMCFGNAKQVKYYPNTPFVHVDDVASAHIFLFENPKAKGRYICSAVEITPEKLFEFVSTTYPEFQISSEDCQTDPDIKFFNLSSKKLLDAGFKYKYGLKDMFDGAIECCKQKGFL